MCQNTPLKSKLDTLVAVTFYCNLSVPGHGELRSDG